MYNEKSMKLNLLNQIDSFSKADFSNLRSKTFFYDLFLNVYKNEDMYTLLYGDIDGLRKLNDEVGFKNADIAIEELLKIIQNYLPENTISCRIGGDEFVFIVPDYTADQTREFTKKIHSDLFSNEKVKGLGITFGACDSSEFNNVSDMFTFVENKVNTKKCLHLNLNEPASGIEDFYNKLDKFVDCTIKSYINNFRFSYKRSFTNEDIKALSSPILNAIIKLLNSNEIHSNDEKSNLQSSKLNIKPETALDIYHTVMKNNVDLDDLEHISIQDLKYVRNCLTTDSITGAHNSVFRDRYLLPHFQEEENQFQVILAESLGIKILNSVLSHSGTDKKIKSTYDSICCELQKILPQSGTTKAFVIHSGGGTFEIFLEGNNNVVSNEDLQNLFNNVNSNEDNVKLFGMIGNCPDVSYYNDVHSKLSTICEKKKNRIKKSSDYFITPKALNLLDISLESLVKYFKLQSKNLGIYNEQEKIKFTKKVLLSLVNNFNELSISNEEKKLRYEKERLKTMKHINTEHLDYDTSEDIEI